jgi:hypothetical protein
MTKTVKLSKDGKSEEKTLASGRKIMLKPLTLEIRDSMFDEVEYKTDAEGKVKGVSALQTTITKWLRNLLVDGSSDEELLAWSMEERTEAFLLIQSYLFLGEEKAST